MTVRKFWKDAATLILAARLSKPTPMGFDYHVLLLQRSSKSKFMPNAFVFPGGVADPEDEAIEWRNILEKYGGGRSTDSLCLTGVNRPLMLQDPNDPSKLPKDIAFRITAIREAFEESGVLLTSNKCQADMNTLEHWRHTVHKHPDQFAKMCCQLELCPDVWSLHEWSDWLTPTFALKKDQGPRRFDTIFYMSFCDEADFEATLDQKEVSEVRWEDPLTMLEDAWAEKLWLAPPQIYELSRMRRFQKLEDLKAFTEGRALKGLSSMLPVLRVLKDGGRLSTLPGDELYPDEPDWTGEGPELPALDMTKVIEAKTMNRLWVPTPKQIFPSSNNVQPNGHVNPLSREGNPSKPCT